MVYNKNESLPDDEKSAEIEKPVSNLSEKHKKNRKFNKLTKGLRKSTTDRINQRKTPEDIAKNIEEACPRIEATPVITAETDISLHLKSKGIQAGHLKDDIVGIVTEEITHTVSEIIPEQKDNIKLDIASETTTEKIAYKLTSKTTELISEETILNEKLKTTEALIQTVNEELIYESVKDTIEIIAPAPPGELPVSYDEDILTILIRDPQKAFAYWDISSKNREKHNMSLSEDETPDGQFYLKIFKASSKDELKKNRELHVEIPIIGETRSCYFNLDESYDVYTGSIEFVPFFDEPVTLTTSNIIHPPKTSLSGEFDENWKAIEKIYLRFYNLVKKELEVDPHVKDIITEEEIEEIEKLEELERIEDPGKIEKLRESIMDEEQKELETLEDLMIIEELDGARTFRSKHEPDTIINKEKSSESAEYNSAQIEDYCSSEEIMELRHLEKEIASASSGNKKLSLIRLKKEKLENIRQKKEKLKEKMHLIEKNQNEILMHRQEVIRRLITVYLEKRLLPGGFYTHTPPVPPLFNSPENPLI